MTVVFGVGETLNRLAKIQGLATAAIAVGVSRGCQLGASRVRGKASGRPGPRNRSGDYRRSIVSDTQVQGSTVLGQIGTNSPQGRRLEFGFVGADSLGRNYNQPPFPHFMPAVPEITADVENEIAKAMEKANL